jgi:hypothetical protein
VSRRIATTASAILTLFEAHLWKENELLVPTLVADPIVADCRDLGARQGASREDNMFYEQAASS